MNTENKIADKLHQQTIDLQAGIIANQQHEIDVANVRIGDLVEEQAKPKATIKWLQGQTGLRMGEAARAEIAAAAAGVAKPTDDTVALAEEVARLQDALCFWLPSITDREDEVAERILQDVFLLVGCDGNMPDGFKSAQELGWVTLSASSVTHPTVPQVETIQWRNIRKVVRELAAFCFGSGDDPQWGAAYTAIVTSLTAKDGLDVQLEPLTADAPAAPLPAQPGQIEQSEMVLVPKWAGQFDSFAQWVNKAQSWLDSPEYRRAMCVDSKGRRCAIGADMARARDEGAFPVYFFWECEPVAASPSPAPAKQPDVMELLANHGGMIVSTAALDSVQIAASRIEKRMYVREDNCGFVWLPPTAPTKRERELDVALDNTIGQRDIYHDWADKLADGIAKHLGVEIGEHSNQNCPWAEALEAISPPATAEQSSAPASRVGGIASKESVESAAPGASTEDAELDSALYDAMAEQLSDLYSCGRVWSAWSVGTMSEDDFSIASEDEDIIANFVSAARSVLDKRAGASTEDKQ